MFDAVTYGAAVGAAKKYTDEHSGSDDAVKYTKQSLTSEQQAQARENIGAAASDDIPTDAVKYTAQTLTDAQKSQARTNIGVVQPDWRQSDSSQKDYIKNKPPILAVYPGTSGSYTGGTGMNNMNEATKQNSIAYGYAVSAKGDYSMAFGYFLQALHDYEIAYGKFNQSNADTAFSIGDGTSNSDRHNLIELKTDGTLLLNGNAVKVKTDADDYPVLGEICGILPNTGSDASPKPFQYARGIKTYFDGTANITQVEFSTTAYSSTSQTIYRAGIFGDFFGYRATSSTTKITFVPNYMRGNITRILIKSCHDMFNGCAGLTTISGLSLFDTSNTADMENMFNRCTKLTTLDLSSFDMTNVVAYTDMFGSGSYKAGITTLRCPKINPHDDIPLPRTLYSQDGTAYTNLPVTTGTSIELRQSWT